MLISTELTFTGSTASSSHIISKLLLKPQIQAESLLEEKRMTRFSIESQKFSSRSRERSREQSLLGALLWPKIRHYISFLQISRTNDFF